MKNAEPRQPIHLTHCLCILLLVIALDQLSKYGVLMAMGDHASPQIITSFFTLVLWWNKGISFSLLGNAQLSPYVLVAVSLVICAMLARLAARSGSSGERIGYAMVIGGALANVIDRVRFGAVIDFLYFHIGALGWPAFNLADSAICLGVGLLLIYLLKAPSRP